MGHISFLLGNDTIASQSVGKSIYELENASLIFSNAWTNLDLTRAGKVSEIAMLHLDHIVNEIMRSRDQLKSDSNYDASLLKKLLSVSQGSYVSPVSRAQQNFLTAQGPGNGSLPIKDSNISMEKLLNKIKHRRIDAGNFRISESGEHVLLICVDKPNGKPDSIIEFTIIDFCKHCNDIAAIL